jgi:adenylate cyclase
LAFRRDRSHRRKTAVVLREEDLRVITAIPVLFGAGVSEGEILRMARVCGDSARRVAQFQDHYLHHTIEEPFRRRGLRDNEALEQEAGVHRRAPRQTEGCAFADLSGYTRLTEESGDEVAARVSLKLAELVTEIASRHRGHVVKMLGDGVHFHFEDPYNAVTASLEIVDSVRPAGLPAAHVGVNAGPMIYEEGDYFGRTVNIVARIASRAGPDQVFVGEDVLPHVTPSGFRLVEVGAFELKGIAKPLMLYEADRDDS